MKIERKMCMLEMKHWKHVFKLDPDKILSDEALDAICESETDAIIVGGTYGVTFDNTIDLLSRIRRYAVPVVLEISNAQAIVPGFDHYFVPFVLNAQNVDWLIKPHREAVKELGTMIPWDEVSGVGYCVLNSESSVAELTKSDTELDVQDIVSYGRLASHLFKLPIFYLEYSGTLADKQFIAKVYESIKRDSDIHIFYGGGICDEQSAAIAEHADTIVVGNIIYDDLQAALATVPK